MKTFLSGKYMRLKQQDQHRGNYFIPCAIEYARDFSSDKSYTVLNVACSLKSELKRNSKSKLWHRL